MRCDVEEDEKNNSANNLGRDYSHSGANFTEPLHRFPVTALPPQTEQNDNRTTQVRLKSSTSFRTSGPVF
jgi:hypothetical protein